MTPASGKAISGVIYDDESTRFLLVRPQIFFVFTRSYEIFNSLLHLSRSIVRIPMLYFLCCCSMDKI